MVSMMTAFRADGLSASHSDQRGSAKIEAVTEPSEGGQYFAANRAQFLEHAADPKINGYDLRYQGLYAPVGGTMESDLQWIETPSDAKIFIRCGATVAVKIIVEDEHVCGKVRRVAERTLGKTPVVIKGPYDSRYVLLLYRAELTTQLYDHGTSINTAARMHSRRWGLANSINLPIEIIGDGDEFLAYFWQSSAQIINYESAAPFAVPARYATEHWRGSSRSSALDVVSASVGWIDLPTITDAAIDQFLAEAVAVLPIGLHVARARTLPASDTYVEPATEESVADALRRHGGIPIDVNTTRRYVLDIGAQVYAATEGQGLHHWAKWAAGAGKAKDSNGNWLKFRAEQLAMDWEKLKPDADAIGTGSLFHEARLRGWVPSKAVSSDDALSFYEPDAETGLAPAWIVPGMVAQNCHSLMIGIPGAGKSFVAADIGLHLATGRRWMGKAIMQGAALYFAAEGGAALKLRMRAFAQSHGIALKDVPFYLVTTAINFGDVSGDADKVIAATRAAKARCGQPVRLIFIDTLAQTLCGGDENGAGMLSYVANVRRVINATDATVVTIHHPNKAGGGLDPRGHSSLIGDADASLVVRGAASGRRTILVNKLRDGARGEVIDFHIQSVELGRDAGGAAVVSGLIRGGKGSGNASTRAEAQNETGDGQSNAALPKGARAALACLATAPKTTGHSIPDEVHDANCGSRVVSMANWLAAATDPAKNPESERRTHSRNVRALLERGVVAIHGEFAWAV